MGPTSASFSRCIGPASASCVVETYHSGSQIGVTALERPLRALSPPNIVHSRRGRPLASVLVFGWFSIACDNHCSASLLSANSDMYVPSGMTTCPLNLCFTAMSVAFPLAVNPARAHAVASISDCAGSNRSRLGPDCRNRESRNAAVSGSPQSRL